MRLPLTLAVVGVPAQAVIIGAITGLAYALLGAGLVLVYRATKVINFAHGQVGALCATLLAKAVLDWHWNFFVALIADVALGGLVGAAIELGVVRRLFDAPRLQLFVATLGISQLLLVIQYSLPKVKAVSASLSFPSPLPWSVKVGGTILASPEIMMLLVAPIAVLGIGLFLTRTWAGLWIRVSADNADMSELSGISTRRVSTMVWTLAGVLAALTSVLLDPVQGTTVNAPSAALGPGLLLPALAAGLVGGLTSLPWTLVGGVAIGILQAVVVVNFPTTPGVVDLVLFVAVLALVLLRRFTTADGGGGQWSLALSVPPRPRELQNVWWARNLGRILGALAALIAVVLPLMVSTAGRVFTFSSVLVVALIGLSVTVLTGWSGQLSLGQFAFAGLGAVTTAALVSRGFSFPVAVAYAVVAGAAAAFVVGSPSLRISGLFLAVTTLGFAVATQGWLLRLHIFDQAGTGTYTVPRSRLFGILDLSSQRTYYYVCLVILVATALAINHLRDTGFGRALTAVRDNERCAASFGLSPGVAKMAAFAFAGGVAALGGALYAGLNVEFGIDSTTGLTAFGPEQSLQIVAMAVIGGLGSVGGTMLGALYVVGLPALFNHDQLVALGTSGVGLLVLLLYVPGGLASAGYQLRRLLWDRAIRSLEARSSSASTPATRSTSGTPAAALTVRVSRAGEPQTSGDDGKYALEAVGVVVRFGGVTALDTVSIKAAPGEVVGLIGSNGAGKSTLMNVVSGFQPSSAGSIRLWDHDATSMAPYERARMGVGRVFQDARLFGGLTVVDTVKVALEVHARSEFLPSLLGYPPSRRLERARARQADELVDFLGLGRYADAFVSNLSTGTRRIVELCCLLARESQLILLDEPTAGVAQRETEAFGPLIRRIRDELDATIVIIEHDMPLVMSISDRVYCLDAGRCIAEGDPWSVRNDPAVIAAYLGTDERAIARSGAVAASSGASVNARVSTSRRRTRIEG